MPLAFFTDEQKKQDKNALSFKSGWVRNAQLKTTDSKSSATASFKTANTLLTFVLSYSDSTATCPHCQVSDSDTVSEMLLFPLICGTP